MEPTLPQMVFTFLHSLPSDLVLRTLVLATYSTKTLLKTQIGPAAMNPVYPF